MSKHANADLDLPAAKRRADEPAPSSSSLINRALVFPEGAFVVPLVTSFGLRQLALFTCGDQLHVRVADPSSLTEETPLQEFSIAAQVILAILQNQMPRLDVEKRQADDFIWNLAIHSEHPDHSAAQSSTKLRFVFQQHPRSMDSPNFFYDIPRSVVAAVARVNYFPEIAAQTLPVDDDDHPAFHQEN